jgi:hypothetical protein
MRPHCDGVVRSPKYASSISSRTDSFNEYTTLKARATNTQQAALELRPFLTGKVVSVFLITRPFTPGYFNNT